MIAGTTPPPAWTRQALGFTVAVLLVALALSWNQPLLDMHDFRQTQTAISAYWMTRGGPLWLYETPLFGPDWRVPFEFPLYQWLVASIAGSGLPLSLDQSGRLVSLTALVACLWPLRVSLRHFGASPELVGIACVLFLAAPIHVFWGRTVMIETLALLLAMGFTAVIQTMVARRDYSLAWAATLLATAAALVKITTFFGFAALAGLVVAASIVSDLRSRNVRRAAGLAVAAALPVCVALAALLYWLDVSDAAKNASPLTAWLSSEQLSGWNHGTIAQRLSSAFWRDTVAGRSALDILGYAAWFIPAIFAASLFSRDRRGMAGFYLLSLAFFLLPMLVFTNLHMIHNYYQVANAVFLVVFAAAAIHFASRGRGPWLAPVLTAACVAAMLVHGWLHFLPPLRQDMSQLQSMAIARLIRAEVDRDDIIITAGLNWAATVPYYSQRRALMVLRETDLPNLPSTFPTREKPGGAQVGALVQCLQGYEFIRKLESTLGPNPRRVEAGGCVIHLRPRTDT